MCLSVRLMAFVHRDQLGVLGGGEERGREEGRKKGEERLVSIYITNRSAQGLYFYCLY